MTKKVYSQEADDAKRLLSAAKAIQADADALGLGAPSATDPERLRLLEAVAEAARAAERSWLNAVGCEGRPFAESLEIMSDHINSYRRAVLAALAALEANDE